MWQWNIVTSFTKNILQVRMKQNKMWKCYLNLTIIQILKKGQRADFGEVILSILNWISIDGFQFKKNRKTKSRTDDSPSPVCMKAVCWLVPEETLTASRMVGLFLFLAILYRLVWEEGSLWTDLRNWTLHVFYCLITERMVVVVEI